jgi:hypothetical protein
MKVVGMVVEMRVVDDLNDFGGMEMAVGRLMLIELDRMNDYDGAWGAVMSVGEANCKIRKMERLGLQGA